LVEVRHGPATAPDGDHQHAAGVGGEGAPRHTRRRTGGALRPASRRGGLRGAPGPARADGPQHVPAFAGSHHALGRGNRPGVGTARAGKPRPAAGDRRTAHAAHLCSGRAPPRRPRVRRHRSFMGRGSRHATPPAVSGPSPRRTAGTGLLPGRAHAGRERLPRRTPAVGRGHERTARGHAGAGNGQLLCGGVARRQRDGDGLRHARHSALGHPHGAAAAHGPAAPLARRRLRGV
jgi:hypothetical protein